MAGERDLSVRPWLGKVSYESIFQTTGVPPFPFTIIALLALKVKVLVSFSRLKSGFKYR